MLKDLKRFGVSWVANLEDRFFNEWIKPNRSLAVSELLFLLTDPRLDEPEDGGS